MARAGDSIEEARATNSSAAGDGAVDTGRANVSGTLTEGTAADAPSEVMMLFSVRGCGSSPA